MDNLRFTNNGIDELDIYDRVVSLGVSAVSAESSARQTWYIPARSLKELGEEMIFHSFHPNEKRALYSYAPAAYLPSPFDSVKESDLTFGLFLHKAKPSGRLPIEISLELEDPDVGYYPATVVVWTELGQLERFGHKVASLADRDKGSYCDLNPEVI